MTAASRVTVNIDLANVFPKLTGNGRPTDRGWRAQLVLDDTYELYAHATHAELVDLMDRLAEVAVELRDRELGRTA